MAGAGYAGDLDPKQAWDLLEQDQSAVLIDCRTDAEWAYVGLPDLSTIGKQTLRLSWKHFPSGSLNPTFAEQLAGLGVAEDQAVLFICRSGQRSLDAAVACTRVGFARCYNVAEGFEGPLDDERHRGSQGGWKARGLPWTQS